MPPSPDHIHLTGRASGSALSLHAPSRHAVLCDPGDPPPASPQSFGGLQCETPHTENRRATDRRACLRCIVGGRDTLLCTVSPSKKCESSLTSSLVRPGKAGPEMRPGDTGPKRKGCDELLKFGSSSSGGVPAREGATRPLGSEPGGVSPVLSRGKRTVHQAGIPRSQLDSGRHLSSSSRDALWGGTGWLRVRRDLARGTWSTTPDHVRPS